MEIRTLKIEGMSCQHCVMNVKKELVKISTVKEAQIGSAVVEIDPTATSTEALKKAVAEAGFEVVSIA
jgi:copper chaperone